MFALVLGVTDQSTVLAGGDANVYTMGLPIATVPIEDFWSVGLMGEVSVELSFFRHANKTIEQQIKGNVLPPPEQQPGLQPALMARSNENEQTVATQKTVGRKRTKRAAAAA